MSFGPGLVQRPGLSALTSQAGDGSGVRDYTIAESEVSVRERIGSGALGEVRLGQYQGVDVALKGLHMLRTDPEAQRDWGGALSPAERAHQLLIANPRPLAGPCT